VSPSQDLLGPTLALTKCQVPIGYMSNFQVALKDYMQRNMADKGFWEAWRLERVRQEFLREVEVRYISLSKRTEGIPATIPAVISKVFEHSEFAVFKVHPERLTETTPES
jgi:hypothetical protein